MGTTDANGIYMYDDTDGAPTPPVLNVGQQSVSNALNAVTRRGIFAVENIAARSALASSLTVSSSNPLYVDRADALPGMRLERSYNGTTWESVSSAVSFTVPMLGMWTPSDLTATVVGPEVTISGLLATTGNVPGGASLNIGIVPSGLWPKVRPAHDAISGYIGGHELLYAPRGSLFVSNGNGNISAYMTQVVTNAFVSMTYLRAV